MPIEFEAIRGKLEVDRYSRLTEVADVFSSLKETFNPEEDITSRVEQAVGALQRFLTLGTLIEFLDEEERSIREAQGEHERRWQEYLEEKEAAIIARLEHAGVDLTGIVDREGSGEDIQEVTPGVDTGSNADKHTGSEFETDEADEAEKKRREIARIRRNLGNVEAFKTGDSEIDKRLEAPLGSLFGVGRGIYRKLGLNLAPTITDLLSHTLEEIVPARNLGAKRFEKILEQLYERGIIPDEKWDQEGNDGLNEAAEDTIPLAD